MLDEACLPTTESLYTTALRVIPYWQSVIVPDIKGGKKVLIAAHGNSLRALVQVRAAVCCARARSLPSLYLSPSVPAWLAKLTRLRHSTSTTFRTTRSPSSTSRPRALSCACGQNPAASRENWRPRSQHRFARHWQIRTRRRHAPHQVAVGHRPAFRALLGRPGACNLHGSRTASPRQLTCVRGVCRGRAARSRAGRHSREDRRRQEPDQVSSSACRIHAQSALCCRGIRAGKGRQRARASDRLCVRVPAPQPTGALERATTAASPVRAGSQPPGAFPRIPRYLSLWMSRDRH